MSGNSAYFVYIHIQQRNFATCSKWNHLLGVVRVDNKISVEICCTIVLVFFFFMLMTNQHILSLVFHRSWISSFWFYTDSGMAVTFWVLAERGIWMKKNLRMQKSLRLVSLSVIWYTRQFSSSPSSSVPQKTNVNYPIQSWMSSVCCCG